MLLLNPLGDGPLRLATQDRYRHELCPWVAPQLEHHFADAGTADGHVDQHQFDVGLESRDVDRLLSHGRDFSLVAG